MKKHFWLNSQKKKRIFGIMTVPLTRLYEDISIVKPLYSSGGDYAIVAAGANAFVYSVSSLPGITVSAFSPDDTAEAPVAEECQDSMKLMSVLSYVDLMAKWNIPSSPMKGDLPSGEAWWWNAYSRSTKIACLCLTSSLLHVNPND